MTWWNELQEILKGKPTEAKLLVSGVFLVFLGKVFELIFGPYQASNIINVSSITIALGIITFIVGLWLYADKLLHFSR